MNDGNQKLKNLRLIHLAMIAAIPILAGIAEIGRAPGSSNWTKWHFVAAALAIWVAWVGLAFRSRYIRRSQEALANDASNAKAIRQWEGANLIALAMGECVGMWGLVVRIVLDGALWQASLFYTAGFLLLLLWTPRWQMTAS
jgi:F0F1-type ATP synthase membrane subunit c/vacuolar-type H+-ATPase subunit K